jgi:hypothetical protein
MPYARTSIRKTGLTINRAGLRVKLSELVRLETNSLSKSLVEDALLAVGRHRIDVAHRLALRAIEADARCTLFANFLRSVVRFHDIEAYQASLGTTLADRVLRRLPR